MPTSLPRTQVTHTPEVADALRIAATRWPDDASRPARLIANLIGVGARTISQSDKEGEPPLLMVPASGRAIDLRAVAEIISAD
ncbi:MAG: hypothetical protein FWG25_03615 [Promicromonosporaceae bacterium]|nr:hypothetical protein [Promicromonosporaceae bacterium]